MSRSHRWVPAGLFLVLIGCAALPESSGTGMIQDTKPKADVGRSTQEAAQLHNARGVLLLMEGNLRAASLELHEAVRLAPGNPVVHNNLGMVLHAQGNYPGAMSEFLLAVQLAPGMASARSNLGFVLFERGDLGSAVEQWQIALKLDQRFAGAWAGLALGLLALGYPDEAVLSYSQALKLDHQYGDVHYLQHVRRWSQAAVGQAEAILRLIGTLRAARSPKVTI